ncbi:Metallo-dependent hydrolase [Schizophyllum commune H4-8]|uniref:Amidohydrolase-related domain-containing protein n=1 Tax=Schizophyllum commune (strain H4-8 / FGSC 9210) TaxID=578458 RepID=D8PXI1_SCHCM|nr:Metallo-dependent hydrolase [Schizophyllum commune H4-8]KAI5896925.1 Metallo-dependent hydrolase [Schizophyllum commune H4-8]
MLFRGTFVHFPSLDSLEILRDHVLQVNEEGFIAYIGHAAHEQSLRLLHSQKDQLVNLKDGEFLLPAFNDLHLHAPQYLYAGNGLDLPLMEWLDKYTYKAEERLDADPKLARAVYKRLTQRLIECGTGAALLFGTIKAETNIILAQAMREAGLRAFVGKLSMDISSRKTYVEASSDEALAAARGFIDRCEDINKEGTGPNVAPVITPRFVPTCSPVLLDGLGALAKEREVRVQSHLAEAHDQVEWVRAERGMEDIEVFDKHGLLTSRTVQAHCTFLDPPDLDLLQARGSAVAHCPLSNAYFSARPFRLREALNRGVKIGLGSDVAGGYALDLMHAMRQAVIVSRMREGERIIQQQDKQAEAQDPNLAINWKEALYLATRGGAIALDLPQGTGSFVVGAPFDVQRIRLYDGDSGVGVGALDFFDLELDPAAPRFLSEEMIEKWWCLGDARNRVAMYVQGRSLVA